MTDQTLTCRDCGATFTFTVGEQEFFASKGFTNAPSRCPTCRAARRQGRASDAGGTYVYSTGGPARGGESERRERPRYPAVCAQCGKSTQVPFQPHSDRPVYCSECFEARRGAADAAGRGRRTSW
jgi:CxxC-x17-CxxC domain-containing protein